MDENVSDIRHYDLNIDIHNINNNKALENIYGIVFIGLLMIVGIPGNITALFVYFRKYKPSTYRAFIMCLAIVDLATCCTSMPFFIVNLRYPILFPSNAACKMFHFLTYVLCLGSVLILVTIAVERYRKICAPHGIQLSERMSKYICILDLIAACFLSWPVAVMYGKRSYETGISYVNGTECTVIKEFEKTKYPAYFNFGVLFVIMASLMALTIIYSLIGKQIVRMKKQVSGRISHSPRNASAQTTHFFISASIQNGDSNTMSVDEHVNESGETISFTLPVEINKREEYLDLGKKEHCQEELDAQKRWNKKRHKTIRITRVLFIITVIFACSFLPHLALRIIAFLDKTFLPNLSFSGMAAYQTFRWTFYINNVANPIIYGLCDRKFVEEIRRFYRSLCRVCFTRK